MTKPPDDRSSIGIRAFGRFVLFVFFSLAFLALAVVDAVRGAPWTVVIAYVICAGVLAMLAQKVFPRRVAVANPQQPKSPSPKRSGNPAIRAQRDAAGPEGKDGADGSSSA